MVRWGLATWLLALCGCFSDPGVSGDGGGTDGSDGESTGSDTGSTTEDEPEPVAKGERLLGLVVNEAEDEDIVAAFEVGFAAGMELPGPMFLQWDEIESAPGVYASGDLVWANELAIGVGLTMMVNVSPVNGPDLALPPDLAGLDLDDPIVVERFNDLLDWVFAQLPDTYVAVLIVGEDVDEYVGGSHGRADQFAAFVADVGAHARSIRPELALASEASLAGLVLDPGPLQKVNLHSDIIAVSHVSLDASFGLRDPESIGDDFADIVDAYPDRPIYFTRLGYPSAASIGSSDLAQAVFVSEVFEAWDEHADHVQIVTFEWLHDVSKAQLQILETVYGEDTLLIDYYGSLGLRTRNGIDKLGFEALAIQAAVRGW